MTQQIKNFFDDGKRVTTSCHYMIGKSHRLCQDFAIAGPNCAVLCDGCSSEPRAEIGAVLLGLIYHNYLSLGLDKVWNLLEQDIFRQYSHYKDVFDISLCATSMLAHSPTNKTINVKWYGDGVILHIIKDGKFVIYYREFEYNAPYYHIYEQNKKNIMEMSFSMGIKNPYGKLFTVHGDYETKNITSTSECELDKPCVELSFENTEILSMMSDGIGSIPGKSLIESVLCLNTFDTKNKNLLSSQDLAFRRLRAYMTDRKKEGNEPMDDISLVTIVPSITVRNCSTPSDSL